ncbi:pyridoxamine 5'-phosphate oxidase [Platysternon megacephalum]|uniref:Pyridoxamine 5'-phosphate oxidase n=1 Tax=Platysternon megacephalum TaxID=55544 RepID=A0A4D9DIQ1_9SAUR|nr:pyridoxamine 5'-phosphate oxidase [Platysternon megacephalum]
MNEGGCAPDGSFYCGSMAYAQTPGAASIYRLFPDGRVVTEATGVTISNGLDFSDDGSRAYYNDSASGRIDVFDWDVERGLHSRRPFVRRYSADGALEGVVKLPVKQVTACTFGGDDLGTLFITTSRENLQPDDDPLAGSVFACTPGVTGRPVRSFGG